MAERPAASPRLRAGRLVQEWRVGLLAAREDGRVARLALQLKSEDTLREDNAELQHKVSEQQDTIYQLIREDEFKESVLDMLRDGESGAKNKHTRALRANACRRR